MQLHNAVKSAADTVGVIITGVREYRAQFYVLYGFRTTGSYATLQCYFNGKGFVTRALACSLKGTADTQFKQLIDHLNLLLC